MAKKQKMRMYVLVKGNPEVQSNMVKVNAMRIVIGLLERKMGIKVLEDKNTMIMLVPENRTGDLMWMRENLFRYVSIETAVSAGDIENKTDRLCEVFDNAGGDVSKLGSSILDYYLNTFYLMEKSASVFEVEI